MFGFIKDLFRRQADYRPTVKLESTFKERQLDRELEDIRRAVRQLEVQASVRLGKDYKAR